MISRMRITAVAPSYLRTPVVKRWSVDAAAAFASPPLTHNSCANICRKTSRARALSETSSGVSATAVGAEAVEVLPTTRGTFSTTCCSVSSCSVCEKGGAAASRFGVPGLGNAITAAGLGEGLERLNGGRRGDGLDRAGVEGAEIGDVATHCESANCCDLTAVDVWTFSATPTCCLAVAENKSRSQGALASASPTGDMNGGSGLALLLRSPRESSGFKQAVVVILRRRIPLPASQKRVGPAEGALGSSFLMAPGAWRDCCPESPP